MQNESVNTPDLIISGINPPPKWELLNEETHLPANLGNFEIEILKKTATQSLEYVTGRIETYIDRVCYNYEVNILEAHLSFDQTAAFHVIFLIKPREYLSPSICAAKLAANEFFSGTDGMDVRVRFMNATEYARSHALAHTYTLMYKHIVKPGPARDGMFRNDIIAEGTKHSTYQAPRYF